jgi:hypothetical protein
MPLTYQGQTKSATEWSREKGIKLQTLIQRIGNGWDVERALNDPVAFKANCGKPKLVTFNGQTKTSADWAKETGIPYKTLLRRFKLGWDVERALTEPMRKVKSQGSD